MAGLAETHGEAANNIASVTEASVREAMRQERDQELLGQRVDDMQSSVRRFEVSHPKLVGLINNIGQTLWKIGI